MKTIDGDSPLSQALRDVSDDDGRRGASPRIEAALLAEVRSRARAARHARLITLTAAASLTLVVSASIWWLGLANSPTSVTTVAISEVMTDFLPLPYSGVPTSTARLVRLEVPRRALESFGLGSAGIVEGRSSDVVVADVLIGDDGLPRAVRFVRSAPHQE